MIKENLKKLFKDCYDEYNELSVVKKDKLNQTLKNLKVYDYGEWFTEEEEEEKKIDDEEESDGLPVVEGDEEVKEGKWVLAQITSGNNSYKLKNETKLILYLSYQHSKIKLKKKKKLQQFHQVIIVMEKNMIATRDPKTFDFD